MYKAFFKPLFDFFGALFLIVLFSPIILVVAICVRVFLGSPILFSQARPGLFGNIFTVYKFRTMTDKKDENGNLLPDDVRLTKFGKFLRSTSLDELPQLFNVLKGDMSFIGPRPLLVEYLPLYNEKQATRHNVKPGITGLAQVNGRNAISWEQKFALDAEYVKKQSFILDAKIFVQTFLKVIKRDGVSSNSHVTMEKFKGSAN